MNPRDIYFNDVHRIHVIESNYKRHRESLRNSTSTIEKIGDHAHLDKSHVVNKRRQLDNEFKKAQLARSNDILYARLKRIDDGESMYAREKRDHLKKIMPLVEHKRHVSRVLTNHRKAAVHVENIFVYNRISSVTPLPEHVSGACEKWYHTHEKFLSQRKPKVTGGHIMTSIPKELRPVSMEAHERSLVKTVDGTSWAYSLEGGYEDDLASSFAQGSSLYSTDRAYFNGSPDREGSAARSKQMLRTAGSSLESRHSITASNYNNNSPYGARESIEEIVLRRFDGERKPFSFDVDGAQQAKAQLQSTLVSPIKSQPAAKYSLLQRQASLVSPINSLVAEKKSTRRSSIMRMRAVGFMIMQQDKHHDDVSLEHVPLSPARGPDEPKGALRRGSLVVPPQEVFRKDLESVLSWNFPLPNQHRNCMVDVGVLNREHGEYLEAVYLRILSTSTPHYIMYETRLTVDQAYEVTNLIKYLPQAVDESTSHIQAILHNMFYEHDTDRNGSLSYEELEVMMRKLGLGISQEDLVKLIAEADSDENGKVDYKEFVNIAAGMLQTFRAKSLANICHNEKAIDDLVEGSISLSEVDKIAGDCVMLLKQSDSAHQGALPAHLIKRRLMRATALGLSPNEITVLCQSLTRNSNGLCVYDSIPLVLYDVRFSCMKSVILESQSSNISEQLSARFQLGIEKLMEIFPDSFLIRTGNLSIRHVVEIMLDIPNLPLSRIQVIMIISEANVVEDSINVSQFIPVAARYIDQMFDPKVLQLKVGAVSAEVPLNGEDGMAMHRRLLLLFKAFDLDFNGTLSYRELTECVKSLNLDISPKQIKALVACAFADSTESALSFDDFHSFFIQNVMRLIQEQENKEEGSTPFAEGRKTIVESNGTFLRSLYMRIAEGGATLSYKMMVNLLQTILPANSCCYDVMVSVSDPRSKEVPIELVAVEQGHLLKVFGYNVKDFTTQTSTSKGRNRRSYMHSTAQTVLNESDIEAKAVIHVANMTWLIDRTMYCVMEQLNLSADSCWTFEDKKVELWDVLTDAMSLLTLMEAHFVYRKCGEIFGEVNSTVLRSLLVRAKVLAVMLDMIDDETSDEIYERLLNSFTVLQTQLHFDVYDTEAPSYVKTEDCFRVMQGAHFLRLTMVHVFFLLYWSDAFEKDGSIVKFKLFVQYCADVISKGFRNSEFLETFYQLFSQGVARLSDESSDMYFPPKRLEELLMQELVKSDQGHGALTKEHSEMIVMHLPAVKLSKDDASIIVASLGIDKKGILDWKEFLPVAYVVVGSVVLSRYIGRRLTMVYSSLQSDSMDYVSTLPLKKLAERLLHVVKVVDVSGEVVLEFPDESLCLQQDLAEDLAEAPSKPQELSFEHKLRLPVIGHSSTNELECTLRFSIENNAWKSKVYAVVEVIRIEQPAEPIDMYPPLPLVFGLPSALGIDLEEAREYLVFVSSTFYLDCDDSYYTTLNIRSVVGKDDGGDFSI